MNARYEYNSNSGCLGLLIRWVISAASIYLAAELIPGIWIDDFRTAIWVALVLGIVNVIVKPILTVLAIPLIVITFGLFLLVINAISLLVAEDFVTGFSIDGFWPAFWASIIISLVSYLTNPPRRNPGQQG